MARAYQLKITLEGVEPEIWRRVVVPGNLSLARLHGVIQDAMGWQWEHLHEFLARGLRIGMAQDGWLRTQIEDERQYTLEQLCEQRGTFQYLYDFGDDWMHEVRIEKITEAKGTFAPRCLAGERACPPEDCGGIGGYLHIVEALTQPRHPEEAEVRALVGDEWTPEAFDVDAADRLVARHRPQPGGGWQAASSRARA
jgi:hypothetical protein